MKKKKSLCIASLVFILLGLAAGGNSVHAMEPYWYGAAGAGEAETSASAYEDTSSISIHVGNRVNQTTAVEFGYVDIDEFDFSGFSDSYVKISGIDISVLGLMPIGESLNLFARVGLYLWEFDSFVLGTRISDEEDDSLLFGLGVDVPLGETLGTRLEWTKYFDIADENVYTLGLELYINF